jgi:signal transduction histidine kinase
VYPLLLSTVLLGVFLSIFSHRAYSDHTKSLSRLRPFVASGHLLEGLLGDEKRLQNAIDEPFRALCEDILNAGRAALVPSHDIAPLFGKVRVYPTSLPIKAEWQQLPNPQNREVVSLDSTLDMDYMVPLGRGVLLLGPRRDGGLYTLEEIEVAQAMGEHLLDSGAGATLASRLTHLQRQKVAEVATLDRHARRVLHDDILPLLHSALLGDSQNGSNLNSATSEKIIAAHRAISKLLRESSTQSPLTRQTFFEALRNETEVELKGSFDKTEYDITPEANSAIEKLPSFLASTLFFATREAIRNASKYGRGQEVTRELHLSIRAYLENGINLEICDNGIGNTENSRDDTELNNTNLESGSGLALHASLLAVSGGVLARHEGEEGGTRIHLKLPMAE